MILTLGVSILDALYGSRPLALPALLAGLGLAAVVTGTLRGFRMRSGAAARPRIARVAGRAALVGYLVVAFTSFGVAGLLVMETWQLFSGARWNDARSELVLERWGPIPDIRIDGHDIESITEVSLSTRGTTGSRRVMHIVVHTTSGTEYWSAPLTDEDEIRSLHGDLTAGTEVPIHRFRSGRQ